MEFTTKKEHRAMEVSAPANHISNNSPVLTNHPIVVNNQPKQVIRVERSIHHLIGFFFHLAFITLLAGLILSIISLVRDDLTKITFHSNNNSYVEYCGWRNIHSYDSSSAYIGYPFTFNYRKQCGDYGKACTLQTVGTTWYSLLIIGIVFAGIGLILFILDLPATVARLLILLCSLIFFGCMLADALIWGLYKTCHKACNDNSFPGTGVNITSCTPKWGVSWILVIIAGGLALLSSIFLLLSKSIPHKHY